MQEKLLDLLKATAQVFTLPSISLSVAHRGREYHLALGQAGLEAQVAATPDTLYCIGSSTKAFIATALCILAQEGRLDLDKPVRDILPWFEMVDPYMSRHLTPRDALSHRSGLPRHDLAWLNAPHRTTRQLVESLKHLPPAFEPRTRFHYQNHMFILATLLVETLTGQPWSAFVSQRIWQPLGMSSTYASGDLIDDNNPRKARPYALIEGSARRMPYNYAVNVGGAGSIFSTTRDMLKWLRFRLEGDDRILSRSWLDDMHTPQMIIKAGEMSPITYPQVGFTSYGLAWFIESYRGHKAVHHGGTIDGFKSEQLFLPHHGIAVSALCNLNNTQAVTSICYKVADLLLSLEAVGWDSMCLDSWSKLAAAMREGAVAAIEAAKAKATAPGSLTAYVGRYSHPAYGDITFSVKDGALFATFIGTEIPMLYMGADHFLLVSEQHGAVFNIAFERQEHSVNAVSIPLESTAKDMLIEFVRQ